MAGQGGDDGPQDPDHTHRAGDGAENGDHGDGPCGQTCDPVKSKQQHLRERIVALPGHALVPLIGHNAASEADQGEQAPQKEVHFSELCELLQHSFAGKAVIRVIEDGLHAHEVEQMIIHLRRRPFEEAVRRPVRPHSVHDVRAAPVGVHHLCHDVDIVLSVTVDRDHGIGLLHRRHEACVHGVLVPSVAALPDALAMTILFTQFPYDLPGAVLRSVIDEQDPAVLCDSALPDHLLQLLPE